MIELIDLERYFRPFCLIETLVEPARVDDYLKGGAQALIQL